MYIIVRASLSMYEQIDVYSYRHTINVGLSQACTKIITVYANNCDEIYSLL